MTSRLLKALSHQWACLDVNTVPDACLIATLWQLGA